MDENHYFSYFNKYIKQVEPVNKLVIEWKKQQGDLQGRGMERKQARNCDLQKLKSYGGPLPTPGRHNGGRC